MEYRIRYFRGDREDESEFSVEANSPNEALVKFRHTCGVECASQAVISVSAAEFGETMSW